MSNKKPSILEGEIARALGRADKLKIANVRGGAGYWVPEDTVNTKTKHITKNGTYLPKDDDCYGYSEVTVNVPKTKITGEDADGDDYTVEVDDDGNIKKTKVPSAIRIVRPPYRTNYEIGDTISFDGLSVVMIDKHGLVFEDAAHPNGILPHSELAFPKTTVSDDESLTAYGEAAGLKLHNEPFWLYNYTTSVIQVINYTDTVTINGTTLSYTEPRMGPSGRPIVNQIINGNIDGARWNVSSFPYAMRLGVNAMVPNSNAAYFGWSIPDDSSASMQVFLFFGNERVTVYDEPIAGNNQIPVNWDTGEYNLKNKPFTDSFEINVTGGSSDSGGFSDYEGGTF